MLQPSHSWTYVQTKTYFEKIHVPQCSQQDYLQQSRHESNLCPLKNEWIKVWCMCVWYMWYICVYMYTHTHSGVLVIKREWNNAICSYMDRPRDYHTAAKSLQSCPTLCDPIDGSPPGSLIPGILQARTLEWVAISFSNA